MPLFLAATIVAGAGQGIAISAATRGLLYGSTLADRAPIFAVIYLLSYSGATIPSLISSRLSNTFSLPHIALGYGARALIASLFTVIAHATRMPTRPASPTSNHDQTSPSARHHSARTGRRSHSSARVDHRAGRTLCCFSTQTSVAVGELEPNLGRETRPHLWLAPG